MKKQHAFIIAAIIAFILWFLFGKRTAVTARIVAFEPVECGPYWTAQENLWIGERGEQVPLIRDVLGPLSAPPNPPDWPFVCESG